MSDEKNIMKQVAEQTAAAEHDSVLRQSFRDDINEMLTAFFRDPALQRTVTLVGDTALISKAMNLVERRLYLLCRDHPTSALALTSTMLKLVEPRQPSATA